jgi:DNA polymerase-3 subunit delta
MGTVHILHGEDEYSVSEAVRAIKASLGPSEELEPNTTVLEGRTLTLSHLKMIGDAMPFFADYRLVVVEGLLGRFGEAQQRRAARRPARSGPKTLAEWADLADYLDVMPAATVLILRDGPITPANALLKSLSGKVKGRNFPSMRGRELQAWITTRAREIGAKLTPKAVALLAEFSGGDLRLLEQEVQKLALYAGDNDIDDETVRGLVNSAREAVIFDLVDAVVEGRQAVAMRTLELLISQSEPIPRILTMLARQVRMLVQAKSLTEAGVQGSDLGAALGTGSDFVVRKTTQQARVYQMPQLRALYQRLLDTDLAIKTGELPDRLAVELFVAEAAASAPNRS